MCACSSRVTGGLLIQEVFHPNQVHKGYRETSGGPHDPTMMVELKVRAGCFAVAVTVRHRCGWVAGGVVHLSLNRWQTSHA